MSRTADVIIIGSGVIGCATAYYLAKKGTSVIVLDKDENIGNGGSARNGGGVRQSGRDPRELPLAMYAVNNLWPTLSEELGVNVEYHKKGNLRLGKTEHHLEILQGLTDRATACGLDVRMIDGAEVRAINPYLSDEVIGASWCATDGHANPLMTTLGYYRAARRLDDDFLAGCKLVVDNSKLYEAWEEEYPYPTYPQVQIIGTKFTDLKHDGKVKAEDIIDITDIIEKRRPGRESDDEIIVYSVGGMPVEDIAWGGTVYRNAVKMGIGIKLPLWEKPEMA